MYFVNGIRLTSENVIPQRTTHYGLLRIIMPILTTKDINLPSPPAIALRILEAVKKNDASFLDLARIIEVDPALTAKILMVANSSFYSMASQINTIEKALSVLGLNVTKNIALSFVIAKEMAFPVDGGFDFNYFWKHAVTGAVSAELLAAKLSYRNEDLFVSALLQDIGVLILYLCRPDEYQQVLDEKRVSGRSILAIEQRVFGFNHQEVGAELLLEWGLPESFIETVRHHHGSGACPEKLRMQIDLLRWSSMLTSIYFGLRSVEKVQQLKAEICPRYKIKEEDIDLLIDEVAEKSVEILSFFEIDPGDMKPFSIFLQDVNEELRRINLSYEQVVMQAKQARQKAEELATELLEANIKLREMAFRDGLTGLYNYRFFQELMDRELSLCLRHHLGLSLMLFDIDHFKDVNDTYGHPVGDQVLRNLAQLVQSSVRVSDIVARYGGEEFAVILPSTDLTGSKVFATRLRRLVEEMETVVNGTSIRITISIGLTSYDLTQKSLDKTTMIKTADSALYKAKHNGRNRVEVAMLPA